MDTLNAPPLDVPASFDGREADEPITTAEPPLESPFAGHELFTATARPEDAYQPRLTSPFDESFTTRASISEETEVAEMLLAELDDEEFTEALEALAVEAGARYADATAEWSHEAATLVPVVDPTDVEAWMESLANRSDAMLAELEQRFNDRSIESITDEELDAEMERSFPELAAATDPLDARELFWGALKKKVKSVAKAAKKVVQKGAQVASKVLPMGVVLGRLRPLIKPLLRQVLAQAIGKLPRRLRRPARQLAQRYGLRPTKEFETESDYEYLAAEFDLAAARAITGSDADDARIAGSLEADVDEPNVAEQLDIARERLVQQLIEAEEGDDPTEALEQFIPVALLPIARAGIKIAGRKRVVDFLAKLLGRLIRPVVGRRLAKPLGVQIADKGLRLLKLEAEADGGRLGAEAIVATTEDTLADVLVLPDDLLANELFLEAAVQDAFHTAARRYFPASVLRSEAVGEFDEERGVWLMMPRATGPLYRYRKYSRALPTVVTAPMAREVVFSDGETLEERIADEGIMSYPVDVEVESYQLLPGATEGHLAAFEASGEDPAHDAAREFDTLDEAGRLLLPPDMERRPRHRRRATTKTVVRVTANGRPLRCKRPVRIRLDLSGARPSIRVHVWLSERRAHALVEQLRTQQHRDAVAALRAMTRTPMRKTASARLGRMLDRRGLLRGGQALNELTDQLFDGLLAAFSERLQSLSPALLSAARDPATGLTITADFRFSAKEAIGVGSLDPPTLTVRPGRHRG